MIREIFPPQTALGYTAMHALRPIFDDAESFAEHIDTIQRPEGYRLVGSFENPDQPALAVAGFRIEHMLSRGRCMYVDDLSTAPEARKQGHASRLLEWLKEEAKRLGCDEFHLDSNVGPNRWDAHRLYFRHGLTITAHHFMCKVS